MQSWFYLIAAIILEVAGTVSMKLSAGFTRLGPSVLLFLFYAACFTALTLALKKLDVSLVYAVWSGVGTALITLIGMTYFREPVTLLKAVSILMIIGGVVGLNIGGVQH